jgi:hypothetical protein
MRAFTLRWPRHCRIARRDRLVRRLVSAQRSTPCRKHGARTSTTNRKYLIGKRTDQPRYREKINHRCEEGQHQPSQNHPPIRQFRIPTFHLTPRTHLSFFPSKMAASGQRGRPGRQVACVLRTSCSKDKLQIGLANVAQAIVDRLNLQGSRGWHSCPPLAPKPNPNIQTNKLPCRRRGAGSAIAPGDTDLTVVANGLS